VNWMVRVNLKMMNIYKMYGLFAYSQSIRSVRPGNILSRGYQYRPISIGHIINARSTA